MTAWGSFVVGALVLALGAALFALWSTRRQLGTTAEQKVFDVLHLANLAAPPFRAGLHADSAERAARPLRRLLGAEALAITDRERVLASDGPMGGTAAVELAVGEVVGTGRARLVPPDPVRPAGVVVPVSVAGVPVGTLAVFGPESSAGTIRAAGEVAAWVATQIELGELDQSQARATSAELRALRAQISPHFVYNALTAIASYVRTDPERGRELLLTFADFARHTFRSQQQFTTLADELHSVDAYLMLERARFGDRLQVTLRIEPEVLPVVIPVLVVQPLVENAVRHGIEHRVGPGRVTVTAEDVGNEALITVEDDGVGMDPEVLRRHFSAEQSKDRDHVGLANVDERMRAVFGDEYGLTVETGVGAGTSVRLRVPKYRTGVRAS